MNIIWKLDSFKEVYMRNEAFLCPGQQVCSEFCRHGHKDWQLSEMSVVLLLMYNICPWVIFLSVFLSANLCDIMKKMKKAGKKSKLLPHIMLKGYSYVTAISYIRQKPEKWDTQGHPLLLLSPKKINKSIFMVYPSFCLLEECTPLCEYIPLSCSDRITHALNWEKWFLLWMRWLIFLSPRTEQPDAEQTNLRRKYKT